MPRATWLADVLRADGLHVIELEGWQGRGRDDIDPQAVICHHTATGPGWSDESVVRLLRDGRPDLKGPLSQLGLRRDGTFDLIAAGRANHNGYGKYGNDSIGIEAYNDGQGERWPAEQIDAFERGSAAILRHLGLPVSRCIGHKESDPTRKIDPHGVDMGAFRETVARHVTADPQEDEMTPEQEAMLKNLHNWTAALCGIQQLDPLDRKTRKGWNFESFDLSGRKDPSEIPRPAWMRWVIENNRKLDVLTVEKIAAAAADSVVERLPDGADAEVVRQAVIGGIRETLGSLDD